MRSQHWIWVLVLVGLGGYFVFTRSLRRSTPRPQTKTKITTAQRVGVPSTKRARTIASPLPEVGPHPSYPTPVAAGTDKIFFLEEPERGPKSSTTFSLPARGALRWTTHAVCEPDTLAVVCGPAAAGAVARWRVGRKGKQMIVAEALRDKRPYQTTIYLAKPDGAADRVIRLDAHGRVAWTRFFVAGQRRYSARHPSGANALEGCGFMSYLLDDAGRVSELGCLQWLGQPMRDVHGVATTRYRRDKQGFILEEQWLGLDGGPIAADDGAGRVLYERDRSGAIAVERYRDVEGKPALSSRSGCHGLRYERDARDPRTLVQRRTCLGADDQPAPGASGATTHAYRYDARGCTVGVRYLGPTGRAVTGYHRVYGLTYEVDERCEETSRTCLNLLEQPLACGPNEPARYSTERDAAGQIVSTKHYAANGAQGADPSYQVFEIRNQWDERGSNVGRGCYGPSGTAVPCGRTGFHAITWTVDDAGRKIEERYLNVNGAPSTNLGCALRRFQYDNYDHNFETRNFDARGQLVEALGQAIRRELYDDAHRKFGILLLDRAGKPAQYRGCYVGATCPNRAWHAVRIVRSPKGSVEKNLFFDAAGQLIHTTACGTVRCFS
jgi:hypothetical protein